MLESPLSYLHDIKRNKFVRNVAIVASGTAGAQAITMAFSPLISRLYAPDVFGALGIFMAMLTVVVPLTTLSYPMAIVLPLYDSDALGIAKISIYLSFVVSVLIALFLLVGDDFLLVMLGAEKIKPYIFLIPLAMLFSAWLDIAQQWFIRKKQYGITSRVAVTHSLLLNGAKAGIGWFHPVTSVLIVSTVVGYFLHVTMLGLGFLRAPQNQNRSACRVRPSLSHLARKYLDFPLYRAPQNFINAVSQSVPVLILASFFGPASAGCYTLGTMVMGLPSTLIGKSVSDVIYPILNEAIHNRENVRRLIVKTTIGLVFIGILPFSFVIVFGPWLFGVFFGLDWVLAGEYARWLALFSFFNFINKPSVAAVPILGIQKGLLFYELFSTSGKILGLLIGFYHFNSDLVAVALFSLIGVFAYTVMIIWIIWKAKVVVDYEKTS